MIIKEIKISNILSFGPKVNFETSKPDVIFGDNMNIIIGPNGSGKTNFVEILNIVFQDHFLKDYRRNEGFFDQPSDNKTYIMDAGRNSPLRLAKNRTHTEEPSFLSIKISLNDQDKNNILFCINQYEELKKIRDEYAVGQAQIDYLNSSNSPSAIDLNSEIYLKYEIVNHDINSQTYFKLTPETSSPLQQFIDYYLIYFNFLKKLIYVGMVVKKYPWELIENTFEFIGSSRVYSEYPVQLNLNSGKDIEIDNLSSNKKNVSTKLQQSVDTTFNIINSKISRDIKNLYDGNVSKIDAINYFFTKDKNYFIYKINFYLIKYLGLEISYDPPVRGNDYFNSKIIDTLSKNTIKFGELSSGQKSIFYLVYSVIGLELKNGFVVIDEPELHLHPNLQKRYFDLLNELSSVMKLQCILITHSPVFINKKSIENTHRFYNLTGYTQTIEPKGFIGDEKKLLNYLNYTNSSKIFFSNKVILVEGDSDNYFFTYLMNKLQVNDEIEILSIYGKYEYDKWESFLKKFEITPFFITDLDYLNIKNILDLNPIREIIALKKLNNEQFKRLKDRIRSRTAHEVEDLIQILELIRNKNLSTLTEDDLSKIKIGWLQLRKKRISFSEILKEIKKNPKLKIEVKQKIEDLIKNNIFVLKSGELEDYLDIPTKGIDKVVQYCDTEKFNTMNRTKKSELKFIINTIINYK